MNEVKDAIESLIRRIMGDRAVAAEYVADPQGMLAETGITETSLTPAELRAMVEEACADLDLSPQVQSALATYTAPAVAASTGGASAAASGGSAAAATGGSAAAASGGGSAAASSGGGGGGSAAAAAPAVAPPPATPPANQTPLEMVEQHINYVTYVTYEGDETITNEITNTDITNIDNSTDVNIDVGEDNDGDITVDIDNVNATDGGVAVGAGGTAEDIVTGDGAVQLNDSNVTDSVINTGENSGTIIGDIDDSAVGLGEGDVSNVSDIDAEGDVGLATGDGAVAQVGTTDTAAATGGGDAFGDVDDAAINTGDNGSAENVSDNTDAAISTGEGDATNLSNFGDGAAASLGDGDASGASDSFKDNTDSNIETGSGDQQVDESVAVDVNIDVTEQNVDLVEAAVMPEDLTVDLAPVEVPAEAAPAAEGMEEMDG